MQPPASEQILFQGSNFADWASLNDTIMGGRSRAGCRVSSDGLVLEGELVETGGGFVSCRSPRLLPPLDLSPYSALQLLFIPFPPWNWRALRPVPRLLLTSFLGCAQEHHRLSLIHI